MARPVIPGQPAIRGIDLGDASSPKAGVAGSNPARGHTTDQPFVQTRGDLRHELTRQLRSARATRRPAGTRIPDGRGLRPNTFNISERPGRGGRPGGARTLGGRPALRPRHEPGGDTPDSPSTPAWRCTSAIQRARGSAAAMRTRTACCGRPAPPRQSAGLLPGRPRRHRRRTQRQT